MAYNEAGHAVNVANFKELISVVESLGNQYAPPIPELTLDMLKKQALLLDNAMQVLNETSATHKKIINDRRLVYDSLNSLVTRVMGTLNFLGLEAKTIQDARAISNKVRGVSSSKKQTAPSEGETASKTVSTSQMSFEQRKNNFERLIALLQVERKYITNEEDLKIESLQNVVKSLAEHTTKAVDAEQQVVIARNNRDNLLYMEQTGAIPIGLRVREYIKSKYTTKSSEYKRVKAIKLNNKR
jgi:hypothetical protein